MKNSLPGHVVIAILALGMAPPLAVMSQTTVFSDNFGNGSTINGTSTPGGTPTASSTSYDIASSKAATTGSSLASGDLKIGLNSATTSGFVEAQAVFTAAPVALATVGDYIDLTYTFTDTANLLAANTSSGIYTGLYNSGGSTPVAGSLNNSGLSTTAGSAYATGNAANWQGYVSLIGATNSKAYTRPLQNGAGTTSANQELIGNGFGGGTYVNPAGVAVGATSYSTVALTTASQYTLDYRLTLSAAGVLTISDNLYTGPDTTGTDISSQTTVTASTLLTSSFDGLAIGVRNSSASSLLPTMDISQITIKDFVQSVPEPSTLALAGLGSLGFLLNYRRLKRS